MASNDRNGSAHVGNLSFATRTGSPRSAYNHAALPQRLLHTGHAMALPLPRPRQKIRNPTCQRSNQGRQGLQLAARDEQGSEILPRYGGQPILLWHCRRLHRAKPPAPNYRRRVVNPEPVEQGLHEAGQRTGNATVVQQSGGRADWWPWLADAPCGYSMTPTVKLKRTLGAGQLSAERGLYSCPSPVGKRRRCGVMRGMCVVRQAGKGTHSSTCANTAG